MFPSLFEISNIFIANAVDNTADNDNCVLIKLLYGVQDAEFPSLASVLYPSWINVIIFVLAGVPSVAGPVYLLQYVL